MIGNLRVANTTEDDSVVCSQDVERVRRHVAALGSVARGAVVEGGEFELEGVEDGGEGSEDGEGRGDDFDADAVAGDGGDGIEGFAGGGHGHRGGWWCFLKGLLSVKWFRS